jgi:predicted transcriptional regulator
MANVPTTLRLSDDLKARVASAAETTGKTSHAFMVEAIEAETRRYELRREFVADALKAEQEVAQYGLVYDADAVHRHFRDKLAGKKPKALKPVSLKTRR